MSEKEALRLWAQTWKQAGPELELLRLREVRDEDTHTSIQALLQLFGVGTPKNPPLPTSGMVEMKRHFAKLRPA